MMKIRVMGPWNGPCCSWRFVHRWGWPPGNLPVRNRWTTCSSWRAAAASTTDATCRWRWRSGWRTNEARHARFPVRSPKPGQTKRWKLFHDFPVTWKPKGTNLVQDRWMQVPCNWTWSTWSGIFQKNPEDSGIFQKNPEVSGKIRKIPKKSGRFQKNPEDSRNIRKIPEKSGRFRKNPDDTGKQFKFRTWESVELISDGFSVRLLSSGFSSYPRALSSSLL